MQKMLDIFGHGKCREKLVNVPKFWIKICRNVALHLFSDLLTNVFAIHVWTPQKKIKNKLTATEISR